MNFITRILTNSWVAGLVLIIAGGGLYALYSKGKIMEAAVGGLLLAIAVILIIKGGKRKQRNPPD
ncbi:MAG: hypothetical protein HY912_14145 [Desulfomonile tiedjei]|uniref:Uncharacterized protein n=1 Tax=Desulfomonile tiedjei TaxID=2358 RepID=A0A9D6V7U8_9BACT|nr:hypothetical protein [Desulfomonile tiedjei]